MKDEKLKGYKGFNENLQCTPNGKTYQYEIGKTYEEKEAKLCDSGFHYCEYPMDTFGYYSPAESRYCEVDAEGISEEKESDSKRTCKKIKVAAEIGIKGIIDASVKFILSRVKWDNKATNTGDYSAATNTGDQSAATNTGHRSAAINTGYQSAAINTGDYSAATNTGNYSAATNTGDYSAATNTGNYSAATNTGDYSAVTNTGHQSAATNTGDQSAATNTGDQSAATNTGYRSAAANTGNYSAATNTGYHSAAVVSGESSVACALGAHSKAKASLGSAIVIAERDDQGRLLRIKAAIVDGKKIKADTFYVLENGKFKKVLD
jgi:hypothetical protein